jgi:hypothetical protein
MAEGGANINPLLSGLNPKSPAFDMDGFIAAAANIQRDCHLPDFIIEKPEAWFKCVEAKLEDAKVVKLKDRYNKVLWKLLVHIIKELAPVTDDPSAYADPYMALKERLLAVYRHSKCDKLDSLLNFQKMGVNELQSVVLAPKHPQARVPGGALLRDLSPGAAGQVPRALLAVPIQDCRGAGSHCRWTAVDRSAFPGRQQWPHHQQQQQHRSGNAGGGRHNRYNGSRGGYGGGRDRSSLLGEHSKMMAPAPMVVAAFMMAPTGQKCRPCVFFGKE